MVAPDEERAQRIAQIREQLVALAEELERLEAEQQAEQTPEERRRGFKLLYGGRTALVVPVAALANWRPRPRELAGATAVIVAAAVAYVTFIVPARTTPGGPGNAYSYVSIPAEPLPPTDTPSSPTPSPSSIPTFGSTTAPTPRHAPTAASTLRPGNPAAAAPITPTTPPPATTPAASSTPPGTPTPVISITPTGSATPCLITVNLPPVLGLCVL